MCPQTNFAVSSIDELHVATSILSNMRRNKLEHCYRSLLDSFEAVHYKIYDEPVGKMLGKLAILFEETAFKEAFCSLFFKVSSQPSVGGQLVVNTEEHTLSLFPLPLGLGSEHEQICGQKLRMRRRTSVIYGHPVIAAARVLRFADHVTKRNGGSGDENEVS